MLGLATARSASGELSDAGVPATSIVALLMRAERQARSGQPPLSPGTVIVMDESSATSTPHAAALAELAEGCDRKLVCIGDPRQIGAVGPGGLYGHLTNEIEPAVLTEIRRQRDPLDRRIVELAHEGRGSDALDLLHTRDRLITRINTAEVSNRERWEVLAVDRQARTMELARIGGDERTVGIGPDYLGRRTSNDEPPIASPWLRSRDPTARRSGSSTPISASGRDSSPVSRTSATP